MRNGVREHSEKLSTHGDNSVGRSAALFGIPHLGAQLSSGDISGLAYQVRGGVPISFDGGRTWTSAVVWSSQFNGSAPIRTNPDLAGFRSAVPLFLV